MTASGGRSISTMLAWDGLAQVTKEVLAIQIRTVTPWSKESRSWTERRQDWRPSGDPVPPLPLPLPLLLPLLLLLLTHSNLTWCGQLAGQRTMSRDRYVRHPHPHHHHPHPCLEQARTWHILQPLFWQILRHVANTYIYAEQYTKSFKVYIYSGGGGLFPFPFPIHLVSIFLKQYIALDQWKSVIF